MDALIAMLVSRPYVVALVAAYWLIAPAERGWLRAGLWFVSGTLIGWLVEFSSVRNGFPFGMYAYHQANFPDELWIGGVPLFASLSFAVVTYFGYSVACTVLSPLRRSGLDVQRIDSRQVANSITVLVLASVMITWLDTVIDPLTHLGKYWLLGDLYHYEPGGIHFDVPLSNYGGWLFTSFCIVLVNQTLDRMLARSGQSPARGFYLPLKPFWSLACCVGVYIFMLAETLYLMGVDEVPAGTPLGGILISGLLLTAIYLVFTLGMIRRGFSRPAPLTVAQNPSAEAVAPQG